MCTREKGAARNEFKYQIPAKPIETRILAKTLFLVDLTGYEPSAREAHHIEPRAGPLRQAEARQQFANDALDGDASNEAN